MHWVLLAVLALVLIFAASRFPKLAFSLLAVLIAVAAGLYYVSDPPSDGLPEHLDPSQVEVDNVIMAPYYAGGFKATGVIRNHSEHYDLTELVIRFTVEDCIDAEGDEKTCSVLSQVEERVLIHVPPGTAKSFEQPVSPRRTKVEGTRRWKFKVVEVEGRRPLRYLGN
ncbi:MAG: hypothetical protein DWQ08_03940 [Proteobacteria bacterium]|nr:MAG: hypothetical protein DWQ08_03940 [Pseudomonadota bacterium]